MIPATLLRRRAIAGNLRLELFIGLGMKVAGAGSSFVFSWLVARTFGASTVGQFQIALTTASILSVWTGLALDNIMIRAVSKALQEGRTGDARASFVKALAVGAISTSAATLALLAVAPGFAANVLDAASVADFLRVLAPLILLLTVIRICAALLRTRGNLLVSQSLDGVIYTSIALGILVLAWLGIGSDWVLIVPISYATGVAIAAVLALYLAWRAVRAWPTGRAEIPVAAGAVLACVFVTAHIADWLSLLIVTRYLGMADAGIYRIAFQVCMLFAIVNTAFNAMMGPHLAAATASRDRDRFKKVIRTAAVTSLAICGPLYLLILIGAEPILELFGPDFRAGGIALRVLATGHVISALFGPIGTALMMMHREKTMLLIELVATAASIAIALLVIPRYGIVGAAAAALAASAVRNTLTILFVRRAIRRGDWATAAT